MEQSSNAGKHAEFQAGGSRSHSHVNFKWIVAVAVVVALWVCPQLNGQSTSGQFNGHVVDPAGAAVVGATVSLLDVETGLVRNTTTNNAGQYTFPLLAPGE